jgi:hypothetical protein
MIFAVAKYLSLLGNYTVDNHKTTQLNQGAKDPIKGPTGFVLNYPKIMAKDPHYLGLNVSV